MSSSSGKIAFTRWIGTPDYNRLLNEDFLVGSSSPTTSANISMNTSVGYSFESVSNKLPEQEQTASNNYLIVSALININGTTTPLSWITMQGGEPTESSPGANYSVKLLNSSGQIINETFVPVSFTYLFDSLNGTDDSISSDVVPLVAKVPYPSNTATVEISQEGRTLATFSPTSKLLRDAINGIPDSGFFKNPSQRRNTLLNKLDAIESQIASGNYQGAREKLINDFKKQVQSWLKDGYTKESALQLDKTEVLNVIDDTIARLQML